MTLNELKIGQSAIITAVGGEGALRNRLIDMGLIPHTKLTLRKVAPLGDPIEIHLRGYELTLRREFRSRLTTLWVILAQCGIAWLVACAAFQIGRLLV